MTMFYSFTKRGSALTISLVVLTAITLGAVVAMQRSTLQVRMVGKMQHQHNVFNAAQNDLGALIDQLRDLEIANELLLKAIQAENHTADSTIDPFTQSNLSKPEPPQNVKSPVNTLRVTALPSKTKHSLKASEEIGRASCRERG